MPGRYSSPSLIARGGMGEVYRARDSVLERPVAVKLLSSRYAAQADARARFRREALAAARLSSSNHVVTVFDVGEHDGRPLIVMEFVEGGSVQDALERGPVARDQALAWLSQAADALDRAHVEGVVHRDVKPSNLLLDGEGAVRVSDFGIASTTDVDTITLPGTILGTVGYLSPEQARGDPVTPASDRYSLAVVGFELLTGKRPFASETATTEVFGHLTAPVPAASSLAPDLPSSVDAVFRRALSKDPAERPASCAELVQELRRGLDQGAQAAAVTLVAFPDSARIGHPTAWFRSWNLRRATGAAMVAVVLTTGAVVAVLASGERPRASHLPPPRSTHPATTVTHPAPNGIALNNEGYALMQGGNYAAALPPLRSAVLALRGTESLTEAYANYNLAFTLFARGSCTGVTAPLALSEQIQGQRSQIDALRARWQATCAPAPLVADHGPANGKGHGKGHGDGGDQEGG